MLVLSRKLGEKIMIGDDVEIVIVEIDRNKVRLGILAPRDVPVHRQEIYQQKMDERQRADHLPLPE